MAKRSVKKVAKKGVKKTVKKAPAKKVAKKVVKKTRTATTVLKFREQVAAWKKAVGEGLMKRLTEVKRKSSVAFFVDHGDRRVRIMTIFNKENWKTGQNSFFLRTNLPLQLEGRGVRLSGEGDSTAAKRVQYKGRDETVMSTMFSQVVSGTRALLKTKPLEKPPRKTRAAKKPAEKVAKKPAKKVAKKAAKKPAEKVAKKAAKK